MKKLTIRNRITVWYVISALLLCAVFAGILYISVERSLYNAIYRMLGMNALVIGDDIVVDRGFLEFEVDMDIDQEILYSVYDLEGSPDPVLCNHNEHWIDELEGFSETPYSVRRGSDLWWVMEAKAVDDGAHIANLRLAVQSGLVTDTAQNLYPALIILFPIVALLSLFAGRLLAASAISPVKKITDTALNITGGDMNRRIHYAGRPDEIGKLAEAFDGMLDELQAAFAREQRFTSDASHELRTPLAVIIAQADSVLKSEELSPGEARSAMAAIYEKAISMQSMLSQMLLLARSREQLNGMESTLLDISSIIEDIVTEREIPGLSLQVDISENCLIRGDLLLITRMIMNLIDNAVKYAGGHIWCRSFREGDDVLIEVEDDGLGISEEDQKHIFERFFRADSSRHSDSGAGLGLSLAEWIVSVHRGSIGLESAPGRGCRFIIRLPAVTKI